MTLPPVRPSPPEMTPGGYMPRYVSPHGHLSGLRERLRSRIDRLGTDKTLPWVGLGLIDDLECVMKLLNLREFAEWLRVNGPPDQRDFADDILADQETLEAARQAVDTAGYRSEPDVVRAIEKLDDETRQLDRVRTVLVEFGAIEPTDTDTDFPALIRALLS